MIGEKIHHYQITRLIGEGGMASVYEAVHEKLQSRVAIKVLNPILTANSNIRQRFENEARFMAGLSHGNITRVIDYEERPDLLAIVMEFLEGEDLNVIIKRNGAMPLDETVAIFTQVLDAFDYAHRKGIVHRDVKPSNIFLEPSKTVKILDFGIAKLVGGTDDMTVTGTQIGTPVYMSPEQVNTDKKLDHRSDIYSLGVTLFYMLNGKPPYDTTTTSSFQIYTKIVHEPLPELTTYPAVENVLKIATHKDPTQRFQTCHDFRQALIEAVQPPKTTDKSKSTALVDDDKTLIDIPELVKKEPKPPVIPVQKEKPIQKKEKIKPPVTGTRKTRSILYTALVVAGFALMILFKVSPGWITKMFNPAESQRREMVKQAEVKRLLDLGKGEFTKEIEYRNYDSAVLDLQKAARMDDNNQEVQYYLGYAIYKSQVKDGTEFLGMKYKAMSRASDAMQKVIKINPEYKGELVNLDPYTKLTSIWGELALKYMCEAKTDSVIIALKEGKKRGGFNVMHLEFARNTLQSCDENAILFVSGDAVYFSILYLQNIENLRTDVKPIEIGYLETKWYFSYLLKKLLVPFSMGEVYHSLLLETPWESKTMTIDNAVSGQKFNWWLFSRTGKLSIRDQVMLDIITTNQFEKPVHFGIVMDYNNNVLNLNAFLHPEGFVNKLKQERFQQAGRFQALKLQYLSFDAIKTSKIPSSDLQRIVDYIRAEFLKVIAENIKQKDRVNALILKSFMEENVPLSNYPFGFKEVESYYNNTLEKIELIDLSEDQIRTLEKTKIQKYMQSKNLQGSPRPSGLYYIEHVKGTGPRALAGQTVQVHYTGKLLNGTQFDSSYDRNEALVVEIGVGKVIKGWDEGIALMNVGSKGMLIIPYDLAYGSTGSGNLIPPYGTLVFEVELLEAK